MPILFPEFEYDIFISYRHNDNLFGRWVAKFVSRLHEKLAASVKKRLTIYFVKGRADGLGSEEANQITNRLSEEFTLEMLTTEPDSEDLYKGITVRNILKSKLAVVYLKHSADWALPFVKQVWRLVGSAGSSMPILFVGEDAPVQKRMHTFKAPRVISRIQPRHNEVWRVLQQINAAA